MISTSNIMTCVLIKMSIAHLLEIKNHYKEKEWLDILVNKAVSELGKKLEMILLPDVDDGEDNQGLSRIFGYTGPDNRFFSSIICDLKHILEPEDYLFLIALLTKSEDDTKFLLQQAQMIAPEKINFQVIYILIDNKEDYSIENCHQLSSLENLTQNAEVRDYILLINLIKEPEENAEEIDPYTMAKLLNRISLPPQAKYTLLYMISERITYGDIEKLLQHIDLPEKEQNWVYLLLYGEIYFFYEDFQNALQMYSKIDVDDDEVDYYYAIEILYKKAAALWRIGNKGAAILQWRDILFSGDYDEGYSFYYCKALVDLGRHYVQVKDKEEADMVLAKLDFDMIDFIEDLVGKDYFLFIAEKALLEADYEKALSYYNKVYDLFGDEEIAEKIQRLSGGKKT